MKTIEEISFKVNETKCTYKLYKYDVTTIRKIKHPVEVGEITTTMGYKYKDTKIKITKYALYLIFENGKEKHKTLVCRTEMYTTILSILKDVLTQYIKTIDKSYTPTL